MACTSVHIHDTAIDFWMHEEARPYTVWFTYGYAIYGANASAQARVTGERLTSNQKNYAVTRRSAAGC